MTQNAAILAWLASGHTLTPLEALERFQTLRLGARAYDLRAEGYDVRSEMITLPNGKRVARYRLAQPQQGELVPAHEQAA